MEHRREGGFEIISYGRSDGQKKKTKGRSVQENGAALREKTQTGGVRRTGSARQEEGVRRTSSVRAAGEVRQEAQKRKTGSVPGKEYDVRAASREYRRRKRRRKVFLARFVCALSMCLVLGIAAFGIYGVLFKEEETAEITGNFGTMLEGLFQKGNDRTIEEIFTILEAEGIQSTQDFLTVNEYSRPAEELKKVKNIFVHYTANPETSAAQNRSYFENLSETHETSASAHFIIGYEGEIVQCIPLEEIAYAVAGRNYDSLSIECCYLEESGKFTEETYRTLVHFTALLLDKYGLNAQDLRRHYDEGGKLCPKYYVENESEWERFVEAVETQMQSDREK